MTNQIKCWIVTGEHWSVGGLRISVHSTLAGANERAVTITREMLAEILADDEWKAEIEANEISLPSEINSENWEGVLLAIRDAEIVFAGESGDDYWGVDLVQHVLES